MSVDLPAPFSPTTASTSPESRRNDTPSSASTPGNCLRMPRTSSSGGMGAFPYSPGLARGLTKNPGQARGYMGRVVASPGEQLLQRPAERADRQTVLTLLLGDDPVRHVVEGEVARP